MNPFRRKVLASMGYGAFALAAAPVFAQGGPRAGKDYIVLSPSLPPESKTTKPGKFSLTLPSP